LLILPACHLLPFDAVGTPQGPLSLVLKPSQVILHYHADSTETDLYPTALRVSATEVRDGQTREHQERVLWVSADPAVATVAIDGTVTAVAPGQTTLTAQAPENPTLIATASVLVKDGGQAHVVLD
jgi:hypothetical protein